MPTTDPQNARLRRALRIMQLRKQVLAAALATFVLAFALVAADGSMGSASTKAATSSGPADSDAIPATTDELGDDAGSFDDSGSFDDGGGGFAGSSADPVQTSQS